MATDGCEVQMTEPDATIELLTAAPGRAGLVMDFDGVLSPIVTDPASSRLLDGTNDLLAGLARRLDLVALISGRPLAFLRDRAPVDGVALLGSYGLEELRDGVTHTEPAIEAWLPAVHEASARLHREFDNEDGVKVEDKAVSVAMHWRLAPDRTAAAAAVASAVREISERTGLVAEPGKLVVELIPPVRQDKGTALARLVERLGLARVVYAGDDLGDLPALRAAVAGGGHALVVTHGPETPPDLLEVATRTFDGVEAFAQWLGRLRAALDTAAAPTESA
ncbi:trehalose-phosphatase [Dactylosporangium sp. CA-139114]|uniref:trehalose-phosphatase n=1 Tax=Dactylosporangium sp. CA-139114 TaxID=3239931 RepID=UPI003D962ECE